MKSRSIWATSGRRRFARWSFRDRRRKSSFLTRTMTLSSNTAVVGQAHALCTLNRDLYHPDVLEYCRARGVLISTDIEILSFLRKEAEPPSL
jgi:hypothetical protein